jgi:methanogenic corrinoid protein MtbC1
MADFASRLRVLRTGRALRQRDLAESLGIAQTTVANYERKVRFPDEPTLLRIADYFGVSLDYLMGRGESETRPLEGLARSYFDLLRGGDRSGALALAEGAAARGLGVAEIYLRVLTPALWELGRLWAEGHIDVGEEHFFTESTQLIMSQLYPRLAASARPRRGLRCVGFSVWGESHVLGGRMVMDLLEMDGWDTSFLGGNLSIRHALRELHRQPPDVLVLSASLHQHVSAAEDLIRTVRNERELESTRILVGGQAFSSTPGLWRDIGADATAPDAEQAMLEAGRLVDRSRA